MTDLQMNLYKHFVKSKAVKSLIRSSEEGAGKVIGSDKFSSPSKSHCGAACHANPAADLGAQESVQPPQARLGHPKQQQR